MATVHTINLIIHVISGFTALTTGLVPMIAKKGGKAHLLWGTVYFWAMFGVFVTSIVSWLQEPHRAFLQYLMFIGFFSFHFTLTGVRTLRLKKAADRATTFDWAVAWVAILGGAGITLLGATTIVRGWMGGTDIVFYNYLYLGFGFFFAKNGWLDVKQFSGKLPLEKMHWFYSHISRMVGAYIATVTAFCVVNASNFPSFVPPLVIWTMPGVIGAFGIARWIRYYRAKFNPAAKTLLRLFSE